jgi:SAM-dependent methyltransferase
MLKRVWNRLLTKLSRPKKYSNLTDYWRDRARRHGKRSVLNMAHGEEAFESVTDYQKQILFPLLKFELSGSESAVLDFGCGPGRFTPGLAELIGGAAIGVDITPELLKLAPISPSVSYQCIGTGTLPFPDSSFDVVWSCLVLGGIPDGQIEQSIAEIDRVLRPGGVFFYVENTAYEASADYWFFRDEEAYMKLASFCNPRKLGNYEDMGQTITIFVGRKG